jgi:hypothetical protein
LRAILFNTCFFFLLLVCPGPLMAQDDSTDPVEELIDRIEEGRIPVPDSVYEETGEYSEDEYSSEDEEEEDDTYYFVDRSLVQDEKFQSRRIPPGRVNEIREQKAFWYANVEFEKPGEQPLPNYTPLGQRTWFRTLIWILIIGSFVAFLAIYLSGSGVGLFRRKSVVETAGATETSYDNIFEIDYGEEINRAEAGGDFRLATRLRYLQLLRDLSGKGVISYSDEKTNFDYLLEVHKTRYYEDFYRVTRYYEFSWYGEFEVSAEMYITVKSGFEKLQNNLLS